jgi:Ca2+-transporting ATPase
MLVEAVERAARPGADHAWSCPADVLAASLGVDPERGLAHEEAARRLAVAGPNELRRAPGPRYLRIVARQLADPLVGLLLAAAFVSAAIGDGVEAAVIGAIVLLNAVLGFVQEVGAERAVVALRASIEQTAAVIRAGREETVAATTLVPGDVLVLREGDRAPADARVLVAERLDVDESALTGESVPVAKAPEQVPSGTPLAERSSMVYAGTGITRGRARALVVATADATEIGRIAALTADAEPPPTPLQQRLGRLSRLMVGVGLVVTASLTAGMVARGESLHEAFLVGVSVAVAAVPEGLAATVTIALAQGARAMAARGAIVRRLSAVETLGGATVIATDKTGTLTRNQMRIAAAHALPGRTEEAVVAAGALASTAELLEGESGLDVVGDPVDGAFLLAAAGSGPDPRAGKRRVLELPFDPSRRRLTVVYDEGDRYRVAVKGAPETLLERTRLDGSARDELLRRAESWAADGLRVLAVAERVLPRQELPPDIVVDEQLELLGLVALHDPLRPAAADAVREAHGAGLAVAMLTGDHPVTAAAIGRALRLDDRPPLTGGELERLDDQELRAQLDRGVFARVTPADKLRLVEAYQGRGDVVAVTGDGVNDTPALRRADVGIAMGLSGTEAAREAAEIVLTDDDFATIVAAIREGRRITDNLRKFVAFLLSANLGEVVLFGIAVLAGIGVPMTVVQVLTVNLLTDGLPALALAQDPASPTTMQPRARLGTRLFSRDLELALGAAGVSVGLAATGAYLIGRAWAPDAAQTMAFATVALAELVFVYTVRSPLAPAWRCPRNRWLHASVAASALVVAAAIFLPFVQELLGTVALGPAEIGAVVGLAFAPALLVEGAKAIRRVRSSPNHG